MEFRSPGTGPCEGSGSFDSVPGTGSVGRNGGIDVDWGKIKVLDSRILEKIIDVHRKSKFNQRFCQELEVRN